MLNEEGWKINTAVCLRGRRGFCIFVRWKATNPMAQHDNVFSLTDIKKKADKIQIFDERTIDEEGKAIPFVDQMALVTHYLQMKDLGVEVPYAKKAEDILDSWCDFATGGKAKEQVQDVVREGGMALQQYLFPELFQVRFPAQENPSFTFIDLFAGIGGFRMAFQNLGGKCVFSSEWDEQAKKTYYANYGEVPFGDITKESTKNLIPKQFDVLCAGFPCQAFSIAGYRKGFEDTRGTLFFDVAEIIRRHRPKAVFLENVKNLKAHDKGNTFKVIKQTLEDMNYVVYEKVMKAMDYANVPQNRERIFIICFDLEQVHNHGLFSFPEREELTRNIHDCLDASESNPRLFYDEKMGHYEELKNGIVSKDTIYQWRRVYVRENKSSVCPTLTANMGTGGHNVPLILTDKGIRKLSPKECLNFQGFPDTYKFPTDIPASACYKQAGNSVVVPLIQKVCKEICTVILNPS